MEKSLVDQKATENEILNMNAKSGERDVEPTYLLSNNN